MIPRLLHRTRVIVPAAGNRQRRRTCFYNVLWLAGLNLGLTLLIAVLVWGR